MQGCFVPTHSAEQHRGQLPLQTGIASSYDFSLSSYSRNNFSEPENLKQSQQLKISSVCHFSWLINRCFSQNHCCLNPVTKSLVAEACSHRQVPKCWIWREIEKVWWKSSGKKKKQQQNKRTPEVLQVKSIVFSHSSGQCKQGMYYVYLANNSSTSLTLPWLILTDNDLVKLRTSVELFIQKSIKPAQNSAGWWPQGVNWTKVIVNELTSFT